MGSASKLESISVADYLAGEELARVKHEYMDGRVFAMDEGKNIHNANCIESFGEPLSPA